MCLSPACKASRPRPSPSLSNVSRAPCSLRSGEVRKTTLGCHPEAGLVPWAAVHCSLLGPPSRQESACGQRGKQEFLDTGVEWTAATRPLPSLAPKEKLPPVKSGRLGWGGFWSKEKGVWSLPWWRLDRWSYLPGSAQIQPNSSPL